MGNPNDIFKPIRTKKVYEEVIDQIKNLIAEKVLVPGDKLLPERELAERLQVSRSSVREAFKVLEILGIIESRPRGGTVLKEPQLSDLIELLTFLLTTDSNNFAGIFEVRQIMEEASAGLAARRATDNDIKRIQKELEAMRVQKEVENLTKADLKFHYAIAVATKNNVLVKIMNLISDLIENFMLNARRRQFANPEVAENYMRQHMAIFEAIARRDEKNASLLMREHLYYAREQLFKALAEEERNQQ